ncbi:DNA cytosine methyltransferase [Piscibacillus salipiscarius]|uniref:DNA cytosine methyltransferase n=1 Tax=Piscibacillus salipiscarius TaxID=299480 RepID=UPI00243730D2|nr:DNA cytosine methyltransferase [Piscibacillus salipiscarius]
MLGGLSLGLQEAGINVVLSNEIDKDIANSYIKNHPKVQMINDDITKLEINSILEI